MQSIAMNDKGPRFSVEPAKSHRSGCRECKSNIVKGELRIGRHALDP